MVSWGSSRRKRETKASGARRGAAAGRGATATVPCCAAERAARLSLSALSQRALRESQWKPVALLSPGR